MTNRYRAIWEADGRRLLVLPRSRKTTLFASIEAAAAALERKARNFPRTTRGLVYDTAGALVFTLAL